MARVVLSDVTKKFGDFTAVDSLELTVADHELLVLLGPSGCGKTTALRMVAGLEEPTEGTIAIGDRVVNDVQAKDRNIAMVFQSYALYPHMTVRRNIEFPLRQRGADKAEIAKAADEAAQSLDLTELMGRKPGQLSGGQRQRVALARAIVRQPAAFLMDEPLSNLDAALRTQTRAEIVALHRRLGTTTLYVTHDQVEAMTMADRVAVMNKGVLCQLGPPQEIYESPADVFVARFIGSPPMNIFESALLEEDGGRWRAKITGGDIDLPDSARDVLTARPGRSITVGVRPESVVLRSDGTLRASATLVELLGHEVHVVCATEDGSTFVVRQSVSDERPRIGDPVRVGIDPQAVHLFDPDTGKRLEPSS
jgi:multiple sugar transport system ATP-binding protein